MKLFKKSMTYKLVLCMLFVVLSCEQDGALNIIENLDLSIVTLNAEGNSIGVLATTNPSDDRIIYTVDFGDPDSVSDVFETNGALISYSYPLATMTYTITVTAALPGVDDVIITKDHTVIYTVETEPSPSTAIAGVWRLAPEAGALGVGPGQGDVSWWSNSLEDVATRSCLFDDEYVLNTDGTFQNVFGSETWIEAWQGTDPEACGAPVFPHDGSAASTYSYNDVAGTLTINGAGAFMGLAKVINGAELAQGDTVPESRTYQISVSEDGSALTLDIPVEGEGWWTFKFVNDNVTPEPSALEGTWRLAPEAGAFGVGPGLNDVSWFSSSEEDITTRACLFDDQYVFNADGSFENILDSETWLEEWQGVSQDACGTPIAPHDGSVLASYNYDVAAGTVTISGQGAYLGLAKVFNGGELTDPSGAPEVIEYLIELTDDGNTMELDIAVEGEGWWSFKLVKDAPVSNPLVGSWVLAPEAGAFGVGPGLNDVSWFSSSVEDITTRACLFDDQYVFNADGSFENMLGEETWLEAWQGIDPDACGTPIAPHDGSVDAFYNYDQDSGIVTISGQGAYLGLAKVFNGGELTTPSDAPENIDYIIALADGGNTMELDIAVEGEGWWSFKLVKQ